MNEVPARQLEVQCKIGVNVLKPGSGVKIHPNLKEAISNLQPLLTMDQVCWICIQPNHLTDHNY